MKKFVAFLISIFLLIPYIPAHADEAQMRAVWFSYEDYASQLASLDEASFRLKADEICKNIKSSGLNTIIFHARAFSDAFYDSSLFPYSKYVCGTVGVSPGYDPLKIMCEISHRNGLFIHAWINPYRIGAQSNVTESSVAYIWKQQFGDERVISLGNLWYYNPASKEVKMYIADGVCEIVRNYEIDGIHFDDYFYPTYDESFDMDFYKASGTSLSQNQWRTENVNDLIKLTYDSIKAINKDVLFGISPNANIEKNYTEYFADVKKWCTEPGYVDYIVPQIYFGFTNETMPFENVLEKWSDLCTVPKLYTGIGIYKSGKDDRWAGSGRNEWLQSSDICARQIKIINDTPNCQGFMLFCYTPVFSYSATESAKAELENITKIINTKNAENSKAKQPILTSFIEMIKALFNIGK